MIAIHRRVGTYLARLWRDIPACVREEIQQEAIALLLERPHIEHPAGWAIGTARILALVWWRREGIRFSPLSDVDEPATWTDPLADSWRLGLLLARAPEQYRTLLVHLYLQDGDLEDFVPPNEDRVAWERARFALYQRHYRAIEWLRRAYGISARTPLARDAIRQRASEVRQALLSRLTGSGWVPTRTLRGWARELRCSTNELNYARRTLQAERQIEQRGPHGRAEYRASGAA